jgi:hypothetical protein
VPDVESDAASVRGPAPPTDQLAVNSTSRRHTKQMKIALKPIGYVAMVLAASAALSQAQRSPSQTQQQDQSYGRTERSGQTTGSTRSQQNQPVLRASAGDIASDPQQYYGQTVRINGEVGDVFGVGVFTLDEDRLFAAEDVLVVAPGGSRSPRDGMPVTVTGTVREFTAAEVRRDYDWLGALWDWNDYNDVWMDWDRRPVVVATSIRTQDGRELVQGTWGQGQQQSQNRQQTAMTQYRQQRSQPRPMTVSAGDIAAEPDRFFGQTVRLRSEVNEAYSPHAFTLDEDRLFAGPDVLVLVRQPGGQVTEGRTVTVEGTVRPFSRSQLQRDYTSFNPNLLGDADELEDWERDQRPVIIARSVRTEQGRELAQSSSRSSSGIGAAGQDITQRGGGSGGNQQQITNLRTVVGHDEPMQLVGNRVNLRSVQVQRVLNDNWIMVGTAQENQLLVRIPQNSPVDINIGDRIQVQGTIRRLPADPARFGLSQRQVQLAEQQDIYLAAGRVNSMVQ